MTEPEIRDLLAILVVKNDARSNSRCPREAKSSKIVY